MWLPTTAASEFMTAPPISAHTEASTLAQMIIVVTAAHCEPISMYMIGAKFSLRRMV